MNKTKLSFFQREIITLPFRFKRSFICADYAGQSIGSVHPQYGTGPESTRSFRCRPWQRFPKVAELLFLLFFLLMVLAVELVVVCHHSKPPLRRITHSIPASAQMKLHF